MKWLILIHVLSAIIGVGPTYFGHVLQRKNQTLSQMRQSMTMGKTLELFPKIGGSIAVLSGLLLVILGDYGSFMKLWLIGSLVLYILIQISVIAFVAPANKKVAKWLFDPANQNAKELPPEQKRYWARANAMMWLAFSFGVLLFAFMIMKPGMS